MQPIKTLNDMIVFLQKRGDKKRVAVVCARDASTRYAVEKALCEKFSGQVKRYEFTQEGLKTWTL